MGVASVVATDRIEKEEKRRGQRAGAAVEVRGERGKPRTESSRGVVVFSYGGVSGASPCQDQRTAIDESGAPSHWFPVGDPAHTADTSKVTT